MYTLHIANKNYSSWSLRPWSLMTELAIPFKEVLSPFQSGSNWEEFRSFSPTGLVPCLVDGDQIVWDSLGIAEYLYEKHQEVWPAEPAARAWARCASAEMHSGFSALRNRCPMNCGLRIALNEIPAVLQKDITRVDELWNEGLSRFKGPWLAGNRFTAVDAFYAPVAFRIRTYGLTISPASQSYVDQILATRSLRTWEEAALQESWREPGHERESLESGVLIEDSRKA